MSAARDGAPPREPRYARSDLTLANAFTGARLVLIPIFGYLWLTRDDIRALWVFVVAVATDLVDGFLARYFNQKSRLGGILDPVADKLLVLVALLVGIALDVVPVWLAGAVIGRDLILAAGALGLGLSRRPVSPELWRPTRIGKYAMVLQSASIASTIVESTLSPPGLRPWVQAVMIATAAITVIAGAQYVVRGAAALAARWDARQGG